jgi:hypothetical protein
VTVDELDALAALQADIRLRYQLARLPVLTWQPAPAPLLTPAAAAVDDGGGA